MQTPRLRFSFHASIWKYGTKGGWYFVSLPKDMSAEIRSFSKWQEEGWGRLKAEASVQGLNWKTAIWYDTKQQTYLLPIKAEIRRKLNTETGKALEVIIQL